MRRLHLCLALSLVCLSCASRAESVAEKAAKLLIVGVDGQQLRADNPIVEDIRTRGIAGVILFGHNVATADDCSDPRGQLTTFVADLKALRDEPLIVAIDQEGGLVNRLKPRSGFEPMVSHRSVGERGDDEYTRSVAATIAAEVASVGINLNFAPCVDVDINPTCPVIGHFGRSFSSDEAEVSRAAAIYVEEHRKRGVLTSLKHFPGHGSSLSDSHNGFTDITTTWRPNELVPYRDLIRGGLCDAVMVSHLFHSELDEAYPATLSANIINGLLRRNLGWDGVVVTDDMQMKAITDHYGFDEAVILALNAGVDLFIVGGNLRRESYSVSERFISIVESAVESGQLDIAVVDRAVARVERLLAK